MTIPLMMTFSELQDQLGLSIGESDDLRAYGENLHRWQKRINLIGKATVDDMWSRHFLDSAQLFDLLPDKVETLIDIDSGAGFPGLVLAVLVKHRGGPTVHLVEADGRKATFLNETNRIMEAGAVVHRCRAESLPDLKADVVTARAVAPLDRLIGLARPFFKADTVCLFPKGKKAREELTESRKRWTMAATESPSLSDSYGTVLKLEGITPRG